MVLEPKKDPNFFLNLNMNNASEKVKGTVEKKLNSSIRIGHYKFSRSISRIAVAQVCNEVGFDGFNDSALDSLSDIAIKCIFDLGKVSKFYANLAGRSDCNVFDVIQGLDDFNKDCVSSSSSSSINVIKDYVESTEENPFAQSLQRFPVLREERKIPSFLEMGEVPKFKHVPAWLPAFPDIHTYVHTPVWNERFSDPRTDKIELARQRRKAESSLLSLQQRLVRTGMAISAGSAEGFDDEDEMEVDEMEESDVGKGLVDVERDVMQFNGTVKVCKERKTEKRVSLLESFGPAIEALKEGLASGSDGEVVLPEKKKSVLLDFKSGKKGLGESLDLRLRSKAPGKTGPWFGREDEKDDKKRRVEFVLRQSLENQQELPHL